MTYQEIKDRLSKCEYTLNCIKDGTIKEKGKKTVKNLELLKESLQTQLKEEEDKGMVVTRDSEEAEKLAKKGVNVNLKTEGPYQTTYIKVPKSDYKKAMAILDSNIDPTYAKMDVVDDDGDDNVIIYFNFRTRDGGEPGEDVEAFIYDAAMDLKAQGVNVTGSSHDIDEARDINDPVLMKLRALKSKIDKKKGISKWQSLRSNQLVVRLKAKRAQVMRDMEQEAEPEGGPIADKYGDMLNKIDAALAKASGNTMKEGQDEIFALGYDLDAIQYVVDYLNQNYQDGVDYELHVGRGDTHPNSISLKNPRMEQDRELGDLLIAAGDNEETDYQAGREAEKDYNEGKEEQNVKLSKEHLSIIASQAGKAIVKAVQDSGDEVSGAKIKKVFSSALSPDVPEAFTVHVIYKNDSEISYRFQIEGDKLLFLADGEDIVLSDVGLKPSGEAVINTELVRNEMTKYFKQMREMTDKEFAGAQESDRLFNHPERDKILAIQNLIAKEKGLKEKVAKTANDVIDPADLALIGTNYLAGFGKEHTLSPEQLIDLGRKIVAQLYKGDIGAALAKHGQESTIKEYGGMELETLFGALGYDNFEEFMADNPGAVEALHGWISSIPEFRKKLGAEFSNSELEDMGLYDIAGYDEDDEDEVSEAKEFETADEWADDGKYYVKVEDNGKGGGWIIDPNHSNYTPGTKLILNTLDEQGYKFEDAGDYFLQIQRMEALKNEAEAEHLINRYGTDLVDELELHKEWHDVMFPEDIEDDDDDDDDDVYENAELDKVTKAKRLIKQQAPAMNKLPQDDPKRIAFINQVKQINTKHKELLAKQDDKISGTGRDQELDEGRGDFDDVLKAVQNMSNNDDISEKEAALEIVYALADKFKIPVDKNLEDYMEEGGAVKEQSCKIGDILTKDGKKGKVIKHSETQATVDFGNGDVYGIAHSRIKDGQIHEDEVDDRDWNWAKDLGDTIDKVKSKVGLKELQNALKEYDIYHKQDWNDDPKEKEARKNNADRKKINKDTLDVDEAEAKPVPDQILRGYNVNVKDAKTMAQALLSMFNQINSKEDKDYTQNTQIKRVIDLLTNVSKEKSSEPETDQAVKEIDTRAARASLDKFAAKEKELDRQNPNRHKEAGKKASAERDAARAAKKKGGNSTAKHTSFYNKEGKINEGATCCGKCGRVHVKGNCKRPYLKGKAHCRNNK